MVNVVLKPEINERTVLNIDRSGCPASQHGTPWYRRKGCICADAVHAQRRYEKFQRAGALPPLRVPIAGTARRLQALAVIGWSVKALEQEWDCCYQQLARWRVAERPTIHRLNATFVARNYESICDIPGGDPQTIRWARKRGYLSPEQLATFDVDDPVAGPLVRVLVPAKRIDLDEVGRFRRFGKSVDEIAEILGVTAKSIKDVERRARRDGKVA